MTHWRMQLHPAKPAEAVRFTVQSLQAGYIGLDFDGGLGDLLVVEKNSLPANQRDYWAFAHEMKEGEWVLIIAHHYPVALAQVAAPYNYIRQHAPELGVWFRHFRRVSGVRYYADFVTNVRAWKQTKMTDTISPLRDPGSISYRLIEKWRKAR